ncbi:MAG TPA: hypothetical protein VNR40_18975 [Steroidobacter sp.]|nr:hypothetical protein [Steroidobacter sp.]
MGTEAMRALVVAVLATVVLGGCTRQSEVFTPRTPEQRRQLAEVTDAVVHLVRGASASEASSFEQRPALRRGVVALAAANPQFRQHSAAIANRYNAEALGCISAESVEIMDLEVLLTRLDEAQERGDGVAVQRREATLMRRAMDATQCAIVAGRQLTLRKTRRDALEHGAVVISEVYAMAVLQRAAAGLSVDALLEDQIRIYESIVTTLGAHREVPVVTEALPKLRALLDTQ